MKSKKKEIKVVSVKPEDFPEGSFIRNIMTAIAKGGKLVGKGITKHIVIDVKCNPNCPNVLCQGGVITRDGQTGRICKKCNPSK